jgi:hypothetical protein
MADGEVLIRISSISFLSKSETITLMITLKFFKAFLLASELVLLLLDFLLVLLNIFENLSHNSHVKKEMKIHVRLRKAPLVGS